jgi:ABC-type transporter Mla subunit MlaD
MHFDPQTLQILVAAVVAGTLLLQVILLVAILTGVRKAAISMRKDIEEVRASVNPLLTEARQFLARVGPQIEATTTDLAAFTHTLREQSENVESTVTDISDKARHQAGRVDFMVTTLLDKADRAGAIVDDAIATPLRQLTGVMAWVRAVVDTLRAPQPVGPRPPINVTQRGANNGSQGDSGMFI